VTAVDCCNLFAPRSVFIPTDHSLASRTAFAHALAFSLVGRADLTILDAAEPMDPKHSRSRSGPGVRSTLQRWGVLARSAGPKPSLGGLGLRVKRVRRPEQDLLGALANHVRRERAELLVLSVRDLDGAPAWLTGKSADLPALPLTPILLVPSRARGFVSLRDGALSLRQILVAVDHSPDPIPALEAAARIACSFSEPSATCRVLRSGTDDPMKRLAYPEIGNVRWDVVQTLGSVSEGLVNASRDADLLVMSVAAREGRDVLLLIRDGFAGQLARRSRCPLLLIPSHARPVPVNAEMKNDG